MTIMDFMHLDLLVCQAIVIAGNSQVIQVSFVVPLLTQNFLLNSNRAYRVLHELHPVWLFCLKVIVTGV